MFTNIFGRTVNDRTGKYGQRIPIITTDVTTMPELLGGIIDLCPVGNAKSLAQMINNLMSHPEMRMRVSQMEFDRVSHNSVLKV